MLCREEKDPNIWQAEYEPQYDIVDLADSPVMGHDTLKILYLSRKQ
jgi:hypothetical protein